MIFKNREDAGRLLAQALEKYKGKDAVILALPRGGVVVGYEVASHLHAPLSLIVVQKIGHPLSPEYAIGAISEDGHTLFNPSEIANICPSWLEKEKALKQKEARRRYQTYLKGKKIPSIEGKIAILVDDGLATGLTMTLAIDQVRALNPTLIVIAVPVSSKESAERLCCLVDELLCLYIPASLGSIGAYYEDFDQVSDQRVQKLLDSI